jgi:hypothetical protein
MITEIDLTVNVEKFHEYTRKLIYHKPVAGSGLSAQNLRPVPGICIEHVVLEDVIELFERSSAEVYDYPQSVPVTYGQVSMWIFQQRDLLWLGGASGRVAVNSYHRAVFSIDGNPLIGTPCLDGIEEQDDNGTIEAFFSTSYLQMFFVMSIKGKPVAIVFMTNAPDLFAEDIKRSVVDRGLYLKMIAEEEEIISGFHQKQESYELLKEMRRICAEKRDEVFSEFALHSVAPEKRACCKEMMMQRGFWNLVGGDLDSVRRFTFLSEIVAYSPTDSELEMVKDKAAWSLCLLEDRMREAGFPKSQIDTDDLTVFV